MEIEIKAWVGDPKPIETALRALCGEPEEVEKADVYYHTDGRFPGLNTLRLRKSGDKWILTFKDKRIEEKTEINREYESVVSDFAVIDELLRRFGCRHFLNKHKKGLLFVFEGLTIELIKVEGLGQFLEIEKILPEEDADPAAVRAEILALFDRLAVPRDNIEDRYYSDMLLERQGQERPAAVTTDSATED